MTLTNRDLVELTEWRRKLHRQPEISNEEEKTAKEVVAFLADTGPDKVLTELGGHGVAAVYDSGRDGPTVLFRSELDALPIEELSGVEHASQVPGKSHMCGHDGHTAILAALGRQFGRERPARGRVVLMFQPAEETGNGAAGVVADPRFSQIQPDFAFSLHNLPGVPFGEVRLKEGVVNCASRGMRIIFEGKTAHSSMPETGISPMPAISALMPALPALGRGTFADDDFGMVTVTHCEMGEAVFGIAPAHAQVWATLRTRRDERMAELVASAEALAASIAVKHGLTVAFDCHEIFVASVNAPDAVEHLNRALDEEGVVRSEAALPMRASEDFGIFGHNAKSAMFFLGAGEKYPALHNPDYDFPDDLIPVGSRIFMRAARNLLG
ncbi:amidohydrolase [Mesorhizobium sp. CU2]|uniref:amidohydrolase n=1 Tax=unclassified Mesorhizobium TaxID=325217 RepID=UPI0011278B4F|nr:MULTISPECIES: amidohydrolase [unclassified Mesorhizobium]TPN75952.1 amidohydrolase [Mesorhizobium sp. CU3]TPO08876.1 amidohydrolase [Mesorhizobium sp. CU2]